MLRTNVFSPLTSRDKCVTDQHRHEHCTETPPTGIPHGEHILTSATHSALHYVVGNKIHPPGYFILSSPCRVILPPPSQYFHLSILPQHRTFLRFASGVKRTNIDPRTFTKCVDAALAHYSFKPS